MAGQTKRIKENFNNMFRTITRKVNPGELCGRKPYKMNQLDSNQLHAPLVVSKLKLLSKETKKWYGRDQQRFSEWSRQWNENFSLIGRTNKQPEKANLLTEQEKLIKEFYSNISRFIGGGCDQDQPDHVVEKVLKKRREKITNKISRINLWPIGTLLEIEAFYKKSRWDPWAMKSWCHVTSDEQEWNDVVSACLRGKLIHNVIPASLIPSQLPDASDKDYNCKLYGLVTDDIILVGETTTAKYCWTRLVRILSNTKTLTLSLHPTLTQDSLHKWIKIVSRPQKGAATKPKTIVLDMKSSLKESFLEEEI